MLLITQFHKYFTANRDMIVQKLIAAEYPNFTDIQLSKHVSMYARYVDNESSYCLEMQYKGKLYIILFRTDKPEILNLEIATNWNEEEIEECLPELNLPSDMDEAAFFQYSILNDVRDFPYALYRGIIDFCTSIDQEIKIDMDEYWNRQYFLYEGKLYEYYQKEVKFYSSWNCMFHECPHVNIELLREKGQKL